MICGGGYGELINFPIFLKGIDIVFNITNGITFQLVGAQYDKGFIGPTSVTL